MYQQKRKSNKMNINLLNTKYKLLFKIIFLFCIFMWIKSLYATISFQNDENDLLHLDLNEKEKEIYKLKNKKPIIKYVPVEIKPIPKRIKKPIIDTTSIIIKDSI
jgi:hypothetical protein